MHALSIEILNNRTAEILGNWRIGHREDFPKHAVSIESLNNTMRTILGDWRSGYPEDFPDGRFWQPRDWRGRLCFNRPIRSLQELVAWTDFVLEYDAPAFEDWQSHYFYSDGSRIIDDTASLLRHLVRELDIPETLPRPRGELIGDGELFRKAEVIQYLQMLRDWCKRAVRRGLDGLAVRSDVEQEIASKHEFTTADAIRFTGVARNTLNQWLQKGKVKGRRRRDRRWLVDVASLTEHMRKRDDDE